MDFWSILLIVAFLTGIMGWTMTPFTNAILWFCDWRDGLEVNWGMELVFTLAVPFVYVFTILEIILLYSK